MSNPFIPATYVEPATTGGRYINPSKLQAGVPFKFRILSEEPLMGWEYWDDQNRPQRLKYDPTSATLGRPINPPSDIRVNEDGSPEKIKHFWAFIVWDIASQSIKILQCTQQSIQGGIRKLSEDEDWGHPRGYDLKLTRTGQKLETEYSVLPGKVGDIVKEALAALAESTINLSALLTGGDPFSTSATTAAPVTGVQDSSRTAAIDALKAAAKSAGFDTAQKVREFVTSQEGTFTTFDDLTVEEIADYTAIFNEYEGIPF